TGASSDAGSGRATWTRARCSSTPRADTFVRATGSTRSTTPSRGSAPPQPSTSRVLARRAKASARGRPTGRTAAGRRPEATRGPRRRRAPSLVAVDEPPLREVVRRELDGDLVAGEDLDEVLPHLPREPAEDAVPALELDAELGVRERIGDDPLLLDGAFLG